MRISLKKTSLVDYPGKVCAVFFFTGCNLRCPWCQNRELVLCENIEGLVDLEAGFAHLAKRRSVLGGVVLSGGEPCIHNELPDIISEIKSLNYKVKLDTNGMNPQMLELLFSKEKTRPDYIALDLKIAPNRYSELAPGNFKNTNNFAELLANSAELIQTSGIEHEYRTLALPQTSYTTGTFTEADIEALAPLVDSSPWYYRPFLPGNCLDPSWNDFDEPHPDIVKNLASKAGRFGKNVILPSHFSS